MSDRIEFEEIDDEIVEVKTTTEDEKQDDGYEKICFLCHRPESTAGKMIDLPNNICVCQDCLQKSFDTMNNMPFDLSQLSNTPGIHFMNLADFENMIPKKQKMMRKTMKQRRKNSFALPGSLKKSPKRILLLMRHPSSGNFTSEFGKM